MLYDPKSHQEQEYLIHFICLNGILLKLPFVSSTMFFAYIGWIIANVSDAEMCKADFYLSFMYRAGNDKIDADINRLKIVTSQNKSWIKAQHFKCTSRNLRHPRKVENAPEFVMYRDTFTLLDEENWTFAQKSMLE